MGKILRAVKYRLSDGGVVDFWSGSALSPMFTRNGPVFDGGPWHPWYHYLGIPTKPRYKLKMQSSIKALCVEGKQGALEITEAEFAALGTVTEVNGRLRWKVVADKLEVNSDALFATDEIAPQPPTNEATLNLDLGDPLMLQTREK